MQLRVRGDGGRLRHESTDAWPGGGGRAEGAPPGALDVCARLGLAACLSGGQLHTFWPPTPRHAAARPRWRSPDLHPSVRNLNPSVRNVNPSGRNVNRVRAEAEDSIKQITNATAATATAAFLRSFSH